MTESTALKHWPDLRVFPQNSFFFLQEELLSEVKRQVQYDLLP